MSGTMGINTAARVYY